MARKRKQKSRAFKSTAPAPIVNIAEKRAARTSLQPERKESIFLAVLTVDGNVHFSHAMTFAQAIHSSTLAECPWQFTLHIEPGKRPADHARNCIVKHFLHNSDCDWLMMIDQDQVIPQNFWQLCAVKDADIVSGLTPVWVGHMDPEVMFRVNNYGVDDQQRCYNLPCPGEEVKQPYRVPIVGTGCIAIRRRVFAPPPHGLGINPFYFAYEDDRKVKAGEDVNFSVDANRLNFVIAVHPLVRFDHMKELPLWQIDRYYHARKALEVSGKQTTDEQRLSIG